MEGLVDFFQAFVRDVGVDLSSGDGGVAEHGLNRSNIGAIHK